jgi:hypothetical protein
LFLVPVAHLFYIFLISTFSNSFAFFLYMTKTSPNNIVFF